jgi:hypothetical protein
MVGLEDPQLVEINALQVSHAHGGDLDDCCIEKSMIWACSKPKYLIRLVSHANDDATKDGKNLKNGQHVSARFVRRQ